MNVSAVVPLQFTLVNLVTLLMSEDKVTKDAGSRPILAIGAFLIDTFSDAYAFLNS